MTNQPPQRMTCDKPVEEFMSILVWSLILIGVALAPMIVLAIMVVLFWA